MSIYRLYSKYWSIMLIILLFPFLLCAVMSILPSHDDWIAIDCAWIVNKENIDVISK